MPTGQSEYFNNAIFFNTSNPLRNYVGQCTWYCWSKAHVKALAYPGRNLNVANLSTGMAYDWVNEAIANGYTVSATPKSDSIAVWGGTGHVAYVEVWDGTTVCFSEANWYSPGDPSGTMKVNSTVYTNIKANVAALAPNVTVLSGGTDGQFKNNSRSSFESRKTNFLRYIYLN